MSDAASPDVTAVKAETDNDNDSAAVANEVAAEATIPRLVDLGGDTDLLAGPEGCQVRIRVCKALLSFASAYFKALFNHSFKENNAVDQGADIVLKEDEPDALVNLCKVLHMKYTWPKPMNPTELLHLAIVADKYSCVEAIRLAAEPLFPTALTSDTTKSTDTRDLMVASFLLDHAYFFNTYSMVMLMLFSDPLPEMALAGVGQRIPIAAWLQLESRRAEVLRSIINSIIALIHRPCTSNTCARRDDWYIKIMSAVRISVRSLLVTWAQVHADLLGFR